MSFSQENILLNDSLEFLRKTLSSQKEELNQNSKTQFDLNSKEKNSNSNLDDSPNKKKSRISMIIEESKNKENIEQISDEEDYLSDMDENYSFDDDIQNTKNDCIEVKKFNIYFFFEFNQKKQYLIPISTEFLDINSIHIYDLIKYIVYKINDSNLTIKNNNIDYYISLKDIEKTKDEDGNETFDFYIKNYEIKPYNFWKLKDCPVYYSSSLLKSIKEENIIFSSKNSLNIMLMKHF